jgi:hypothetical protein
MGFETIPEEEDENENQEDETETEGEGDIESGRKRGKGKQQKRPSYSSSTGSRGSVANPILTAALNAGKPATGADVEMTGQPDHPAYLEETMPLKASSTSSSTVKTETLKEKIRDFYRQYNPTKLDSVDEILLKYQGKEEMLLKKLHKQYNVAP